MTVGGEARPLSLQAFLEQFFGGLTDRGIAYCVLRNYAKLPVDNAGTDVDVLVNTERLKESVHLLCNIPGVTVTGCVRQGNCMSVFLVGVTWSGGDAIQVELIHKLDWKGLPYLQAGEVLKRAHRLPGQPEIVRVPAAADEAVVSFFSGYLVGGWIKEKYQAQVRETFANERETIQRNLKTLFGASLTGRLIDAVIADDRDRMLALLARLRWTLLLRSIRGGPVASFRAIAYRLRDEAIVRWTPKYLTSVSVLGPDGAGKSALLEALEMRLAHTAKPIKVRHLKPDIFFRAHRQSRGVVTDPHGKPPRSVLVSVLKLVFWTLELWVDRLFTARCNSPLEIWDRYYHDVLVDPKRYRYQGPMWLVRAFGWFVPSPDLFIILDAPTEVLQDRKREVAPEETERQRQSYRDLADRLERCVVIDANRPFDITVSDAAAAIVARMAEKTQRFLGRRP